MASHSNLYVYGLPPGTDDAGLRQIFEGTGNIVSVRAIGDRRYGFVKYSSVAEAQAVIGTMNGSMVNGARLTVMAANRDQVEGKDGSVMPAEGNGEPAPSPSLFVRGLPASFTMEHTKMVFEMYGTVISCQVLTSSAPTLDGLGETTAIVQMGDVETAMWMVANLDGNIPQGLERPISVSYAIDPASKPERPGGQGAPGRYAPYGGKGSCKGGGTGGAIVLPSGQAVVVEGEGGKDGAWPGKGGPDLAGKGFKTRLCTYFTEQGYCPSGDNCNFAHGGTEVKGFRTRMCKFEAGTCPQGDRCSFAHSGDQVKGFKSRLCKFELGSCPAGDKCSFAHGAHELRGRLPDSTAAASASSAQAAVATTTDVAAALSGVWSALGSADLSSLAALGIDVNALAALGQAAAAMGAGAQLAATQPAMPALGNGGVRDKGGSKGSYKTRLCTFFADTGVCPSGTNCTFAHGAQEIHGWKTRLCRFAETGCPQGNKCSFAHSAEELRQA